MSGSNVKLPGEAYSPNIRARFWLTDGSKSYLGVGRIELLEKIDEYGSISQAAKSMGMSYKKAWKLIDELNGMYSEPMIVKVKGGKSGGGSLLTETGRKTVEEFKCIEVDLIEFLQKKSEELFLDNKTSML